MAKGFKISKTNFIGIEFTKKDGTKELVKPCKEVKKDIEKYFDKRNGINAT